MARVSVARLEGRGRGTARGNCYDYEEKGCLKKNRMRVVRFSKQQDDEKKRRCLKGEKKREV